MNYFRNTAIIEMTGKSVQNHCLTYSNYNYKVVTRMLSFLDGYSFVRVVGIYYHLEKCLLQSLNYFWLVIVDGINFR